MAMARFHRHQTSETSALDLRYVLLALAYLAMVFWLTSRPELGGIQAHGFGIRLARSLHHVPLYAGLGFFMLQAISGGEALAAQRARRALLTFFGAGAFAALAEWHQVYVPGRDPSLTNFLLDLTGIAAVLLVCWLGTEGDKGLSRGS
ncbi:MAG TPA: VanZ family protein [bacterium]|nr:VanZ family protein [bacterium]